MRYIVTGGAGFIGSNLAETLAQHHDVIIIDNLATGRREKIEHPLDRRPCGDPAPRSSTPPSFQSLPWILPATGGTSWKLQILPCRIAERNAAACIGSVPGRPLEEIWDSNVPSKVPPASVIRTRSARF